MKTKIRFLALAALALCMALAACSRGGTENKVNLTEVRDKINADLQVEDAVPLDADELLLDYGIQPDDIAQNASQIKLGAIFADEYILVQAVDGTAAARVKDALQSHYDFLVNQAKDYAPEQVKLLGDCEVTQNGNYVSLIVAAHAKEARSILAAYFQ